MRYRNEFDRYPLTLTRICPKCKHVFSAVRTKRVDRDGYPQYKVTCPDCIQRMIVTRTERHGPISIRAYDTSLKEGFLMSGMGGDECDT